MNDKGQSGETEHTLQGELNLDGLAECSVLPIDAVEVIESIDSTNRELLRRFERGWKPNGPTVLVAQEQRQGYGRLGRSWNSSGGLALSLALPAPDLRGLALPVTLLPLIVGEGVRRALQPLSTYILATKWPNDVVTRVGEDEPDIPGWGRLRKLSGVLIQLTPAGDAIIGVGTNVVQEPDSLPVPWAASMRMIGVPGVPVTRTEVARRIISVLAEELHRAPGRDAADIAASVAAHCVSIGSKVRVEIPADGVIEGVATGIEAEGGLRIIAKDGEARTVSSGDVLHLRLAPHFKSRGLRE